MCLPPTQVDQFYGMWIPLLNFVNKELEVVPDLYPKGSEGGVDINSAIKVRDSLWKNVEVLDQFIQSNPSNLSLDDLSILDSWRYHRGGTFIIFKSLKKYALFISQDKKESVYAVKGLKSSFEALFGPYIPLMIECVLLPFHDEIITDGLFRTYNISFGGGIRRRLKVVYDNAKECGEIITSLSPIGKTLSWENQVSNAEVTNKKVLEAFQKHLYSSELSQKTIDRDISTIQDFAQALQTQQINSPSLRDFGRNELATYLQKLPITQRKTLIISLKRFISFLRDTDRVNWDNAASFLDLLKQP